MWCACELALFYSKIIAEYEVQENAAGDFDDKDKLYRHYFDVEKHWGKKARLHLYDHNKEGYLMFDDLRTVTKCSSEDFSFILQYMHA